MRIYLATWLFEKEQQKALSSINHAPRLISYYHTKEAKEGIKEYIRDENLYSKHGSGQ